MDAYTFQGMQMTFRNNILETAVGAHTVDIRELSCKDSMHTIKNVYCEFVFDFAAEDSTPGSLLLSSLKGDPASVFPTNIVRTCY